MTPADFQKKYVTPDYTLSTEAFTEIDKMYAPGLGLPAVKVYSYNPNYCITEACAQDLSQILGPMDNGSYLSVIMNFPNGPSGPFFDSGMCAFFGIKSGLVFNVASYISAFTHGLNPQDVVNQIRAYPITTNP